MGDTVALGAASRWRMCGPNNLHDLEHVSWVGSVL